MKSIRFPIGEYLKPETVLAEHIQIWTSEIAALPKQLESRIENLTDEQLEAKYREEGWTVRQLVHHIADAYMNSFIHFKLALTEDNPTIKPYHEDLWAELADEQSGAVNSSLQLLNSIVARWVLLLDSMTEADFNKTFVHPVNGQQILGEYLGFCTWHGKHHLEQINVSMKQGT